MTGRGNQRFEGSKTASGIGVGRKTTKYNLLAYLLSDQNEMVIKVIRFAGKDKTTLDQRAEFKGQCLLLTVQQVLECFTLFNLSKKITINAGIREETPLIESEAFREAWINACVHNTWIEQVPPSVYIYDDRLEVVSYGGLPFGLSEEGFFAGTSKPVNNRLFTIFIGCGFSERTRRSANCKVLWEGSVCVPGWYGNRHASFCL